MTTLPTLIRSLALTTLLSFTAPVVLFMGFFAFLCTLSWVPGLETLGQTGANDVLQFLAIFGNGCFVEGLIVIGLTCSFVAALFDTYAFYSYQHLNDH
ncbi:MAG: hypothetical protein RIE73_21105 [Coleofasciculus sp. C1-SOL-03]|jgi:hypothetical protein|uniref:hypothetical protein n=1 Tax=Coleofasciculus sp. C1-SOL-03 TaxID=3069522 RepID=UPI0032FCCB78